MVAVVYRVTNKINLKKYYGMTTRTLEGRWGNHLSAARQGSNFRFHCAIRKYGIDNWILEVVEESDDIQYIRELEEQLIREQKTTLSKFGYNAKPGGCGGWIVKPENYELWKGRISAKSIGESNGKFSGITNDEIEKTSFELCNQLGYIPHLREYVRKMNEIFPNFPKSMAGEYRKPVTYNNIIKKIEEETGLKVKQYKKTEAHKKALAEVNKGKKQWYCEELKINRTCKEEDLDKDYKWIRGRKKWR